MIEIGIGGALFRERCLIIGEAALGQGLGIDHSDDAIDRDPRSDLGPVEGTDQRLGQGEARGLDDNMLRRVGPVLFAGFVLGVILVATGTVHLWTLLRPLQSYFVVVVVSLIVSSIVADHHAYIRVRENQPRGVRMVIEFPLRQPDRLRAAVGA